MSCLRTGLFRMRWTPSVKIAKLEWRQNAWRQPWCQPVLSWCSRILGWHASAHSTISPSDEFGELQANTINTDYLIPTMHDSDVILFHMCMPVDFCSHLVDKKSENSLWQSLNTLCWYVRDHTNIFWNKLIELYLNNMINLRHLTRPTMSCYTHKMAIVSWPQTLWLFV